MNFLVIYTLTYLRRIEIFLVGVWFIGHPSPTPWTVVLHKVKPCLAAKRCRLFLQLSRMISKTYSHVRVVNSWWQRKSSTTDQPNWHGGHGWSRQERALDGQRLKLYQGASGPGVMHSARELAHRTREAPGGGLAKGPERAATGARGCRRGGWLLTCAAARRSPRPELDAGARGGGDAHRRRCWDGFGHALVLAHASGYRPPPRKCLLFRSGSGDHVRV